MEAAISTETLVLKSLYDITSQRPAISLICDNSVTTQKVWFFRRGS